MRNYLNKRSSTENALLDATLCCMCCLSFQNVMIDGGLKLWLHPGRSLSDRVPVLTLQLWSSCSACLRKMSASLAKLLQAHKVSDLASPKKVVVINGNSTLNEGFRKLIEAQVLSAPVIDSGKAIGLVDMADVVAYIVHLLGDGEIDDAKIAAVDKQLMAAGIVDLISMSFCGESV